MIITEPWFFVLIPLIALLLSMFSFAAGQEHERRVKERNRD